MFSFVDPTSEYLSHAVILICDKGTNDSQLFLAALDTLISLVTDPMCQLRMYLKIQKKSNKLKFSFQQLKYGRKFLNVYVLLLIPNYILFLNIIHVKCIQHV